MYALNRSGVFDIAVNRTGIVAKPLIIRRKIQVIIKIMVNSRSVGQLPYPIRTIVMTGNSSYSDPQNQ
jgi:hypothetical protein